MKPLSRYLFLFVALLFFSCASAFAEEPTPVPTPPPTPLTYVQLRNELMDFADRYMQIIGQASDTIQHKNIDAETRLSIHSMKLFPVSAAFTIASDSSPRMALLDMIVLVYLQGDVWKETAPARFGDDAKALLDAQQMLEDDIDAVATRALGLGQLQQLKLMVKEWRAANPNQRYVSYIRFTDFADLSRPEDARGRRNSNPISIANLLSAFQLVNVDEASRSVDQARMVAERAIYLSARMPTLLRWQTEMFVYEIAAMPETKHLMETNLAMQNLPTQIRSIVREAIMGLILVALVVFLLAIVYKIISRRIL